MKNPWSTTLSDSELLAETARVASVERHTTAQLLALLAEVETRSLHLAQGYSSMFKFCTQALHLSESAAYSRITAARAARTFPLIPVLIAEGAVTLTTITLLAGHLTGENHQALLAAAAHRSKLEVERLVASLKPKPDVASSLRRLPIRRAMRAIATPVDVSTPVTQDCIPLLAVPSSIETSVRPLATSSPVRRSVVAPLSADRYLLKVTLSEDWHTKLQRARDLLRHQIPSGDAAAIVDRALTALLAQLEKAKQASTRRPRAGVRTVSGSRRVPAAVKRAVWERDEGQCAFVGADGRCRETGFLEFHHVVPFARGGPTSADNLQLRCRAHNAYDAEREFGPDVASRCRTGRTLSRQSSPGASS